MTATYRMNARLTAEERATLDALKEQLSQPWRKAGDGDAIRYLLEMWKSKEHQQASPPAKSAPSK